SDGRNVSFDYRWTVDDADELRKFAAELVTLAPDVILSSSSPPTAALLVVSRTIPIVFVQVADPVGAGFVASLAWPGGNATGFMPFEYSIAAKWLELLKEIAPAVKRVAVLREATNPGGMGQAAAIQSAAAAFSVEVSTVDSREAGEIEREVTAFARAP